MYEVEKASYWWTKPQLQMIRDEYKDEVMMEGVRKLVKARVQQEEDDDDIIEERVEEVMKMDHGSIANFLQSVPTKPKQTYNSKSYSDSDSDSDTDSDSDSDSESDSSSSSSSYDDDDDDDNNNVEKVHKMSLNITAKPKHAPESDSDDDSSSSSSSQSSSDDDDEESVLSERNEANVEKQTQNKEDRFDLKRKNRKSGKRRFKQGALAIVAIDRLRKLVKNEAPPPTSIRGVSSSSDRLIDMYLPSDEETEDDNDASDCEMDCEEEDQSSCPVCLNLVDAAQERKIILLRRMLCKECYFTYYVNREENSKRDKGEYKSSERDDETQLSAEEQLEYDTRRDIQILSSSKRCISSTEMSPVLPELPMSKSKSSQLRDSFFLKSDEKSTSGNKKGNTGSRRYN